MPVRCGAVAVTKAYCGTNEIVRGYCGENLFFAPNDVRIKQLTKTGATIAGRTGMGMVGSVADGLIFGGWTNAAQNDFYQFVVTGDTVNVIALTKTGAAIEGRNEPAVAGDSTSGIIFGGNSHSSPGYSTFFGYARSGNTVTIRALTKAGSSISGRIGVGIVGDATTGIIFGGLSTANRRNDFYRYVVSGSTITLTALTRSGASIAGRYNPGMVGTTSTGIIFGGWNNPTRFNDFWRYVISGNNVTITALSRASGTITARNYPGMAGNATAGLIMGGNTGVANNDFYTYSVSGNQVTVVSKTNVGDILPVRVQGIMVGTANTGVIAGGVSSVNPISFYTYAA